MNNKIKDILSQCLIIALTAMLFVSCSSDPDSEPNPGGGSSGPGGTQNAEFAPDYVAGKEFKFYGIKDGEYDLKYRVVAATDPMKAKIYWSQQNIPSLVRHHSTMIKLIKIQLMSRVCSTMTFWG